MTRQPSRRGQSRAGLFWQDGGVENPLLRECPTCRAGARQRCTRPARGGRRPIAGYHPARTDPPETTCDSPSPSTSPS